MVDKDELWIGERLKVSKSGKIGSFEGINFKGKIRIKVGEKIFLYSPEDLEMVPEDKIIPELIFNDDVPSTKIGFADKSIDLHIEKLNPALIHALPERIVDFQIVTFENYLEHCISSRRYDALIIHGRGTGVLRTAIHTILKSNKNVRYFHLVNNDGATEVLFQYL